MALRLYVTAVVYDPATESCRTALDLFNTGGMSWYVVAERHRDNRVADAKMLILADITPEQHTAAIADARITHVPLEKIVGQLAADADTVADVPKARRDAVQAILQQLGVDTSDVQGTWTILRFLRTMRDRIHALAAAEPAP